MAGDLNALVTWGRFQPATGVVQALHDAGARVDVADTCKLAPALHSHAAAELHVTAPPSRDPVRFARDVAEIVRQRAIDLVVPVFEEGFYLTRYAELVPAPLFAPPFETIARLHNKARFAELCHELDLRTPRTIVVASQAELREAIQQFDEFVARPTFSRGGAVYLTNHGPRAAESSVDDCQPTDDNPWLVQEYVDGQDACSFSIARQGEVLVHCPYEPTIPSPGGFAMQFASIADFGSLEIATKVCAELGFTGFIGFDYRRTKDGFVMIECNPRCSAGVFLTPRDWVGDAILGRAQGLCMVEPGQRCQYDVYLLDRHMTHLPARQLVHELLTTPDAFMAAHDVLPALYVLICRRHFSQVARREHISVTRAYSEDVWWNGSPMPDISTSGAPAA